MKPDFDPGAPEPAEMTEALAPLRERLHTPARRELLITAEHVRRAEQVVALTRAAEILSERQSRRTSARRRWWQVATGGTGIDDAIAVLRREAERS